ncbi:MAG: class I SAM-dependent methyltransferase [Sporichthyaceae bacterium]
MAESLPAALAELRELLLDPGLTKAVAAGRRHGAAPPPWRRVELRPVQGKAGPVLQEVCYDARAAYTRNLDYPEPAGAALDELLAAGFGSWHVATAAGTVQVRVTKKGHAQVHRAAAIPAPGMTLAATPSPAPRPGPATVPAVPAEAATHDRVKPRLIDPGDPLFDVLGATAAKRRQVDAFLRLLAPTLPAVAERDPLQIVDLGCGNAYLSFAAHRYLAGLRADRAGVALTGVDIKAAARERNTTIAARLGASQAVRFVEGTITGADLPVADIALALHACDTATDEALARAVRWQSPVILAAPCCHHETAARIRAGEVPPPYPALTRHGILRERLADVLTDALRALVLRLLGYRVDVVEFIGGEHTARNIAIRAVFTDAPAEPSQLTEYHDLVASWGLRPHLVSLLHHELMQRHGGRW